jgi:hypothetical protein
MDSGFGNDVGVEAVTEVDGVDVVAGAKLALGQQGAAASSICDDTVSGATHHSRSLYMIVKKTWRNRLTAFISTANRYNHASPVIVAVACGVNDDGVWRVAKQTGSVTRRRLGTRLNKCEREAQGSDAVVCLRAAGLDAGSLACVRGLDGSCDDVGDATGNRQRNAMVQ